MPHSGGRVGRGIYFASENSKSAGYGKKKVKCLVLSKCTLSPPPFSLSFSLLTSFCEVRCAGNTGIMFLNEVALGKEFSLYRDDSSLTAAPGGYDCVVARGHTEPGEKGTCD